MFVVSFKTDVSGFFFCLNRQLQYNFIYFMRFLFYNVNCEILLSSLFSLIFKLTDFSAAYFEAYFYYSHYLYMYICFYQ